MTGRLTKIIDKLLNEDVRPKDVPDYTHIEDEHLINGEIVLDRNDDDAIKEVFQYNARAKRAKNCLWKLDEAKKGYYVVNSIVFLGIFAVLKVLKMEWGGFLAWPLIYLHVAIYLYSRINNKLNVKICLATTAALIFIHIMFIFLLIINLFICYTYDRSEKRIRDELGYPKFPSIDLVLTDKSGSCQKIFAREME